MAFTSSDNFLDTHRDEAGERLLYHLAKPRTGGETILRLEPLELLDRLAILIPPPRSHRHRYCGVLAPNARLRKAVTSRAGLPVDPTEPEQAATASEQPHPLAAEPPPPSRCSSLWAALLARIYEVFPLLCPNCGEQMHIIAFITDAASIDRILSHIGEPNTPPPIAPARAPPLWDSMLDQTPAYDLEAPEPVPDLELDQTQSW